MGTSLDLTLRSPLYDAQMKADQLILDSEGFKKYGFLAYDHMEMQKNILMKEYVIIWHHYYEINPDMIVD